MRLRRTVLWFLLILPGLAGTVLFVWLCWLDWQILKVEMATFTELAQRGAELRELVAAEGFQNVHRINVFCDLVCGLLSYLLCALGVHGLCVMPRAGGDVTAAGQHACDLNST